MDYRIKRVVTTCVIVLFVLAWVARLTPMARLVGFGPRFAIVGAIEILVLAGCVTAIAWAATHRRTSSPSWIAGGLIAAALGWIALSVVAAAAEPGRDRSAAARRVSAIDARTSIAPSSGRVLLIGIDGMDWNAVAELTAAHRLPTLATLAATGRTYQLDNHGLGLSPAIWARLYTGAASRRNRVEGFANWKFPGVRSPVAFLPQWHHRPLFMIDRALRAGARLSLWQPVAPTNADLEDAPIWRIASAAGRRVGVFDPLPFDVVGERINGFFLWQTDDGYRVAISGADDEVDVERVADDGVAETAEAIVRDETRRARVAGDLFARVSVDLGIYYTHVLDAVGHMTWEPAADSAKRARTDRGRPFGDTVVADAYDTIDAGIATLIERFGRPATVIIVSDHGWDFTGYAHRTAPYGVVLIAGAGARGFGGTVDAASIASTVLCLAQIPAPGTLARPVPDLFPRWNACGDCQSPVGQFLSAGGEPADQLERRRRLRSLGYIGQ